MRIFFGGLALVALAACETTVPDSAAGVGFGDYDSYQQAQAARDAALNGEALPPAASISSEPLSATAPGAVIVSNTQDGSNTGTGAASEAEALAAATTAALTPATDNSAAISAEASSVAVNASGISDENNFDNVSSLRSIEGDKQRIEQNRAQYQVVEPTALPSRSGSEGPNIVSYALETSHPKGTQMFKRFAASQTRANRNCAKYASPDLAQAAFLAKGGPQKDRMGIDPDGDGYACFWDPAPYRKVNGG